MNARTRWVRIVIGLFAASALASACGGTDGGSDLCKGPKLLPDQSPIILGEMYPSKKGIAENPGDNTRVPVERTVLLESTCRKTVEISTSCLVGENDEGDNSSDAEFYTMEGPTQNSVPSDAESAVRLTYERKDPNNKDDIDNVALVVQSNAVNYPTMVIPFCARVVKEGTDRKAISCTTPVQAPPQGEKKTGICGS